MTYYQQSPQVTKTVGLFLLYIGNDYAFMYPNNEAVITVVSSITCSSAIHLLLASFTSSSTDAAGVFTAMTMSIVSWFDTNSHNPSVATTMHLSVRGSSSRSVNSGNDETPAVCATESPRDLKNAKAIKIKNDENVKIINLK